MKSIKDIIKMKNKPLPPFANAYKAFFLTIENDLIAKANGEARVKSFLKEYDELGILYIVKQFALLKNDYIVQDLIKIFNVDIKKDIPEEYCNQLEKNLLFMQ